MGSVLELFDVQYVTHVNLSLKLTQCYVHTISLYRRWKVITTLKCACECRANQQRTHHPGTSFAVRPFEGSALFCSS